MPRTGQLQLIAFCEGWHGKQEKDVFVVGETFDVVDIPLKAVDQART